MDEPIIVDRPHRFRRPKAGVDFLSNDGEVLASEYGLIDTGATWSLLPFRLMEPLGFTTDDCFKESYGGAAGSAWAWSANRRITMRCGPVTLQAVPSFAPDDRELLLGLEDFLHGFRLVLDLAAGEFRLDPSAALSGTGDNN